MSETVMPAFEAAARRSRRIVAVVSAGLCLLFLYAVVVFHRHGTSAGAIDQSVSWGLAAVNMVWWVGVASAAIALRSMLALQGAVERDDLGCTARAIAIGAAACAGTSLVFVLGRPLWLPQLLIPQPASPSAWDAYAIGAVAAWAFATPAAVGRIAAALGIAVALAVQTVMSWHFGASFLVGWHGAGLPVHFLAGALLSGLAVCLMLAIVLEARAGSHPAANRRSRDAVAKAIAIAGIVVLHGHLLEVFAIWLGGNAVDWAAFVHRVTGPHALIWLLAISCSVLAPQALWLERVRRSAPASAAVCATAALGIWLDRFVLVVGGADRGYFPSTWRAFDPTAWDWTVSAGMLGPFLAVVVLLTGAVGRRR